jgi:nucleoside-diphosphate-sugar epimerase
MGAMTQRVLVTGAGGFLGQAIVDAALDAGHAVSALRRSAGAEDPRRDGLETVALDFAAHEAGGALDAALEGVDSVIHAAAAMGGDDAAHARDTIAATDTLIAAMVRRSAPPRLVLVSSISVYNYASMPAGALIDETTPLEPEPALRDAYCRAKLAQEARARRAAQHEGLAVRALRPGAIVGPGRLRTARLGYTFGPALIMPGGDAQLPIIDVTDCAAATIRAAEASPTRSDYPAIAGDGWFEAINLAGADQPSQTAWTAMIRPGGWPKATLRAPLRVARAPAQAIALVGYLAPDVARHAPGPLRLETFDARFKPLRFSVARAIDRLGVTLDRPASETARRALGGGDAP